MKMPKCLPALLFALCALCLAGTPYADDNGAAAETPRVAEAVAEVKAESETTAAGEAVAESPAAAETAAEVKNDGQAASADPTETKAESETPAAATDAKTETPAATETASTAPATITDKPAPGATHPQEISIIPFKGYDLDGKRVDVGACIGEKPVLLVFWASWCPTCKTEVPHMNKLAERFGDRMAIVGVNIAENDTYKRAKAFAAKADMRYPSIYDGSQLLAWQYAIRGLPTVVVADKKGVIRYYGPGAPEITEEAFAKLTED